MRETGYPRFRAQSIYKLLEIVLGIAILVSLNCERANSQNPPTQLSGSNAGPCNESKKVARVRQSATSTGETVEGPACVEVGAVNTVRYFVTVTTAATQTAGASPASIFPTAGINNAAGGAGSATVDDLRAIVRRLQTNLRELQDDNRAAAAKLDELIARLKEFVSHSDESVGSGQFGPLVSRMAALKTEIDHPPQSPKWRASDELLKSVHLAQNDWGMLPVDHPEAFDAGGGQKQNTDTYNALKTQLADLESQALSQASGSDAAKAVGKNLGLLTYWSDVFGGFLNPDGSVPQDPAAKFTLHQTVTCGTLFNFNRQVAVKLAVGDRLPFFDGQQMSTQIRDAFVTVNCGSPFSLSAGVGLSFVGQREFAIVQSATAPGATSTVNKFGYSSVSSVTPVPLALAHLRVADWGDHRYALHASFGVAANVQGTNGGGSSASYLPGVSLSLFRTMYLTGGAYIGKQGSLAGGFKVGDIVPTNITAPPVQSSYKAGFGLAITFTKP